MFIGSSLAKKSIIDLAAATTLNDGLSEAYKQAANNLIDDSASQIKGGIPSIQLKTEERGAVLEALAPAIMQRAYAKMVAIYTPVK